MDPCGSRAQHSSSTTAPSCKASQMFDVARCRYLGWSATSAYGICTILLCTSTVSARLRCGHALRAELKVLMHADSTFLHLGGSQTGGCPDCSSAVNSRATAVSLSACTFKSPFSAAGSRYILANEGGCPLLVAQAVDYAQVAQPLCAPTVRGVPGSLVEQPPKDVSRFYLRLSEETACSIYHACIPAQRQKYPDILLQGGSDMRWLLGVLGAYAALAACDRD